MLEVWILEIANAIFVNEDIRQCMLYRNAKIMSPPLDSRQSRTQTRMRLKRPLAEVPKRGQYSATRVGYDVNM